MIRRICLFILLVFTLNTMAQTIGEAFYIYRNDGEFNAFFRNEVDSIAYSNYDADSLYYDEVVTQLVYTADSLYRIPLAVIDSVSFVHPETIYAPNVTLYKELKDYIVNVEGMRIDFTKDIPTTIAPNIGDVLFFEVSDDFFPDGFAGKIKDIYNENFYSVVCDTATLQDVYVQVVKCLSFESLKEETSSRSKKISGTLEGSLTIPISVGADLLGTGASVEGSISFISKGKLVINMADGNVKNFDASLTFKVSPKIEARFDAGLKGNFDFINKPVDVPLGTSGVIAKVKVTPFLDADFSTSLIGSLSSEMSFTNGIRYDNGTWTKYKNDPKKPVSMNWNMASSVSLFFGIKTEASIGLAGNIARLTGTFKLGDFAEGTFIEAEKGIDNANAYERKLNSELVAGMRTQLSIKAGLYASVVGTDFAKIEAEFPKLQFDFLKKHYYEVPVFTNPTYSVGNDRSEAIISCDVSRELLHPVDIGLALFDTNNNIVDSNISSTYFGKEKTLSAKFTNLTIGQQYTCSPIVRIDGDDYRALPSIIVGKEISITTAESSDITSTSVVLSGQYKAEGVSSYGFCYTKKNEENWKWANAYNANQEGRFSAIINYLEPNTNYEFCAYVICDGDYYYGNVETFTTKDIPIDNIITGDPIIVNNQFAEVEAFVSSTDINGCDYGVDYYFTSDYDNRFVTTYHGTCSEIKDGKFTAKLYFYNGEKIWYRAFLKRGTEIEYGEIKTVEVPRLVQTGNVISIGEWYDAEGKPGSFSEISAFTSIDNIGDYDYGLEYYFPSAENWMYRSPSHNFKDGTFSANVYFVNENDLAFCRAYLKDKEGNYNYGKYIQVKKGVGPDADCTVEAKGIRFCGRYAYFTGHVECSVEEFKYGVCYSSAQDHYQSEELIYADNLTNGYFTCGGGEPGHDGKWKIFVEINGNLHYSEEKTYKWEDWNYKYDLPTEGLEVDLGLGVNWASHNVGSTSYIDKGDLFAWGETETKDEFTFTTYTLRHFGAKGSYNGQTWQDCDFNNIGGNISGTEYDAAHVNWGNEWRMPTITEANELNKKCLKPIAKYQDVEGRLYIGPNGNSIFVIPASPIGSETADGIENPEGVDRLQLPVFAHDNTYNPGIGWTSSCYGNWNQQAYYIWIGWQGDGAAYYHTRASRVMGMPVRPVRNNK